MPTHAPIGCIIIFTEPDLFPFSFFLLGPFPSACIHSDDEGRVDVPGDGFSITLQTPNTADDMDSVY